MKHFTIKELTHSTTAVQRGIDNMPNDEQIENLKQLVENVLDPLREAYGRPIRINSGFRSKELNVAIGGSKTSDHVNGNAADITAGSQERNRRLFELIQSLNLPFDQLIDEKNFSWVHVSFRKDKNRKQILKIQ